MHTPWEPAISRAMSAVIEAGAESDIRPPLLRVQGRARPPRRLPARPCRSWARSVSSAPPQISAGSAAARAWPRQDRRTGPEPQIALAAVWAGLPGSVNQSSGFKWDELHAAACCQPGSIWAARSARIGRRTTVRGGNLPCESRADGGQAMSDITVERSASGVSVEPLRERVRGQVLTGR